MEEEAPPTDSNRSICNPVYEAAPEPAESNTSDVTVSHSDLKNLHKLFLTYWLSLTFLDRLNSVLNRSAVLQCCEDQLTV